MPLGTLDRNAPSLFRQGPTPLTRLLFFSALSVFLMVADARFHLTHPLRAAVDTALYPLQWVALQPVRAAQSAAEYFESLHSAQMIEEAARHKLAQQSQRANQVEQLLQENTRLRELLALRERFKSEAQAAEVLYDAPDPYTRRVIIDRGQVKGVALGSPVIDEAGVLGQVTRVDPLLAEVTLVIDRDFAIPVLNTRTGARSVAYGDPIANGGVWSCATCPPTPMCRPAICCPPAGSMASTPPVCRWPGSTRSNAGLIRPLHASIARPWGWFRPRGM